MKTKGIKVVGLTGGIGSGKSTVAAMFKKKGIAVYIADKEAKRLMNEHEGLKTKILQLFGEEAYVLNKLNRTWISAQVFSDKTLLEKLNNLVHPEVAKDFVSWSANQEGPYVIKEAAILFENEGYKRCDYTILVIAPKEDRIERVIERDMVSREQVLKRIQHQWDDEKKVVLADFVLSNTNLEVLPELVEGIHEKIMKKS